MNKRNIIKNIALTFLLMFVISSCKHKEKEYHSLMDKIEAKSKTYDGSSIVVEKKLNNLQTIEITEDGYTFLIPERKSQIKSYACNECHTESLDKLENKEDTKNAHWDIKLNHADKNTMNCMTCHDENNMNDLKSLTAVNIDFNNSYNQCSQCHSKQFNDWKGGAHGKNIGGWTSPRATFNCVNCHNPHKPHFESRWPARFNTQIEIERK